MTDLAMSCQSSAAYLFATAAAALVPNKATEALVLKRISDPCDLDLLPFNGKRRYLKESWGTPQYMSCNRIRGKQCKCPNPTTPSPKK
jgi:hypothetical protein